MSKSTITIKSITYTEDEDYIAVDPKEVDHDKLMKEIENHAFSAVIVEYNYKGGK